MTSREQPKWNWIPWQSLVNLKTVPVPYEPWDFCKPINNMIVVCERLNKEKSWAMSRGPTYRNGDNKELLWDTKFEGKLVTQQLTVQIK